MPNALSPITAPPPSVSDLAISTPLWRLLSSSLPSDGEIAEILSDPALHAEARRIAPALAEAASPCGDEAVRLALQPLVLVFGVPEGSKSQAFWAVYYKTLGSLPAEALAKAVE